MMEDQRINVTKSFLPDFDEYAFYLRGIFERGVLTNQGPLVKELEHKLTEFLQVSNLQYVTNGTIALQLAIRALSLEGSEIITTPFSYVATTSSILWEGCTPVFVDIEPDNFTIDPDKIEQAITPNTKAIMAVHVFGYACNVERIDAIAKKHNLEVIYDAAHAFGSKYRGKSLLDYGDISTLSFHATKLFHTVEGGACVVKDAAKATKLDLQKRFGHTADDHVCLGINGKTSELHAAMGLANFPYIERIIAKRKTISNTYDELLKGCVGRPKNQRELEYNYAYYPVVFQTEEQLLNVFKEMNKGNIYPRRYFYPSLNTLPYVKGENCTVSESISNRIACLPLYVELTESEVTKITSIIKEVC